VLITSLESETPGRFSVDVEEAYVNIKKLPFLSGSPLGLKLKVGRFRPAFGNFNRLHTHDLPQTFRPLAVQEFLGEEGFVQNGLSGNFFIPTPWDEKSSLDFTLEFLNGGDIAISPELQGRRSYLGHLRWFRTFKDTHNLELGWSSYYHPSGNNVPSANLHGFDFIYRWKPLRLGEWKSSSWGARPCLRVPGYRRRLTAGRWGSLSSARVSSTAGPMRACVGTGPILCWNPEPCAGASHRTCPTTSANSSASG